MTEVIIDMDNVKQKGTLWAALRVLSGRIRFTWVQHRARRSDRQLRYYWPCFVSPFAQYLAETYGSKDPKSFEDRAHSILKDTFLRVPEVDASTGMAVFKPDGDPLMRTRSTGELSTEAFNEYLDNCAELLGDLAGITVPEPAAYHEREARKGKAA